MNNHIIDDIKWSREDGRADLAITAWDRETVWLGVIERLPRVYRHLMLRLDKDENGTWAPANDSHGIEVYDITKGGDFERLPAIPDVVSNSLSEVLAKLTENAEMIAELGITRERQHLVERIRECEQTIADIHAYIERQTAKLEAEVRAIDPDAKLVWITPSASPQAFRTIVESEYGPLILQITTANSFTLYSPRGVKPDQAERVMSWKDGQWVGLPAHPERAQSFRDLGETILHTYRRELKEVAWNRIAIERHSLMLEEQAADLLETKTLPDLRQQLAEFDAGRQHSAPKP